MPAEVAHLWTEVKTTRIASNHVSFEDLNKLPIKLLTDCKTTRLYLFPHLFKAITDHVDADAVVQALAGDELACADKFAVESGDGGQEKNILPLGEGVTQGIECIDGSAMYFMST